MQVVVALKDLDHAKSRLGDVLDRSSRRTLVMAMAADLVDLVCSHSCFRGLTIVAGAGWREHMFSAQKLTLISEGDLGARGLNHALEAVVRHLGPQPGLVLHGDLPGLGDGDLVELHTRAAMTDVVLCPDEGGTGTNAIASRSLAETHFAFGPNSFSRHLKMAMTSGHSWHILRRSGFSRDLDTPADLLSLLGDVSPDVHLGLRTRAWVRDHRRTIDSISLAGTTPAVSTGTQGAAIS